MSQKRNRGRQVKAEAARLIEAKMREKGFSSREKFALEIGLTSKTLDKFFLLKQPGPQRKTVEEIASFLELNPADIVEDWYPSGNASETEQPLSETAENFKLNYRQICEKILREKINKLTTTPLTNNDGATLNLDDVYVPLGLVEPKQKPGKGGDISAEMGGQFYQYADYEVTRKFENNQFFDEVIAKGETPKSQGRKIAIVGEPGAGKTTLLQKIAFKNPDYSVAIWISLAELKGKTVEEYLLQVWLKSALKVTRVTPDLEDALAELFKQGKVWLLLDGVDEMGVNNSLGAIASQISGWVVSARVILTCRLNVWDAGKNDLYSFDVYRNLDFNEGQIEQFIGKWFDEDLKSGKSLLTELKKPAKERIRDLIKNPLRLTMLCWFWQRREGSLPETKVQLYQRFVEVFYEWKDWQPHPFPKKSDAQKALEKAFGELAQKAIDESSSRFRLTRRQVCDVLGEPDEPLFDLAKRLGWLNLVGVAEENKDEPVYAFFHPTFQEYFAALNIDDWDFFLPREHNNSNPQPVNGKKYRIFDAQWKEVILLWLGREDVEKEDKEEFIKKLVEFKDGCGDENFYGYRAFFLAAAGIAEFKNCRLAALIVEVLFKLISKIDCALDLSLASEAVLKETSIEQSILLMTKLLEKKYTHFNTNELAQTIVKILTGELDEIVFNLSQNLNKIANTNTDDLLEEVIFTALQKLRNKKNFNRSSVDNYFIKIDDCNNQEYFQQTEIANTILNSISDFSDEYECIDAIKSLGEIGIKNQNIIQFLTEFLSSYNENICLAAANSLGKIDPENPEPIKVIGNILSPRYYNNWHDAMKGEEIRSIAAQALGKIGANNSEAINILIDVFNQTFITEVTHGMAAGSLIEITNSKFFPLLVSGLKDSLEVHYEDCFSVIWHCTQNMTYPEFYYAWHNDSIQTLEKQVVDIPSQLQPTDKTYPIPIAAYPLQNETDKEEIAQELCNQIYQKLFPENHNIPTVNNASQLKRLIPQIKTHLNAQNIALILQNCEPNPPLIKFCHKLSNAVSIAWLTDAPLEPPLRGFPPNQINLKSALETWLNELE